MSRKTRIVSFTILSVLLWLILQAYPATVSGQANSSHLVYMPVLSKSPAPPSWVGPDGGSIIAIDVAASQPSTIYAGTWGSGTYKSTNGGKTWTLKSQGLAHPYINSIAVDPHNPQIAYTGTYKGKLYKTIDGGEHWFLSSANIQDEAIVYSIVIDPLNSNKIFIGTRGISKTGGPPWNGVLYRSKDAGNSWVAELTNVGGSDQEDWAYAVTLHPRFPNLVYAATHEHGIYRSFDSGNNWEAANAGIIYNNLPSTRGIVVNPNSPKAKPILYTGLWKGEGVFRSDNGGVQWFPVSNGSTDTHIYSMSINPNNSDIVYASTFSGGVLKTSDGGNSWKITGLANYEVPFTAVNPQNPQVLYAGTMDNGLYKSSDNGKNWQPSYRGLHATNVSTMQVSPDDPKHYFAGMAGENVKHSTDGGQNWSPLGTNLPDSNILGLVIPPDQPQILYALTESAGLHRCNLNGTCWEKVSITFPQTIQAALDPSHPFWTPALIEEAGSAPNNILGTPAILDLHFATTSPNIAYLGTAGAGVYKSMDGGSTWHPSGLSSNKIVSLATDPTKNNRVFAAGEANVWYSNNGGDNWVDMGYAGGTIYVIAVDPSGNIYTGTSNGVYQYTPEGWIHLGLDSLSITALKAHPEKTGWLYAGTPDGLRISRDGGLTWWNGPVELDAITIRSITFDPADPSWLFISTKTQGVLRMQY